MWSGVLIVLLLCTSIFAQVPTTPHFPEVFKGKCYDKNPVGVDCDALYGNFSEAAMTDNSILNEALYEPFFALANFSTPKSSILFWSGNMAFALAISTNDPRFVTVEETSTGYVLNSLSWCGTREHTFDYNSPCYYPSNATYFGTQGVWSRASKMFAQGAHGDIYVLLEPASIGGTPPVYKAFRNTSIFASIELPEMIVENIDSMTILLLGNSTRAPEEKCGSGSLLELNQRVKEKFGYVPKCIDDPKTIYTLLCPRHTSGAQCLAATLVYNYEIQKKPDNYLAWAITTTCAAVVFFIIILVLFARMGMNRNQKGGNYGVGVESK